MTTPAHGQLTQAILRMRTPLARVELAASRLARSAATPATRGLVEGISEAVRQIDHEISDSLRVIRPAAREQSDFGDARGVLTALRRRTAAVLQAYEIRWPPPDGEDQPILADRVAVEKAALVMLRAGIALAGRGGSVELSLVHHAEASRTGLRLAAEQAVDAAPSSASSTAPDPLTQPLAFALGWGGSLDVRRRDREATATLWLAPSELA